MAGTILTPKKLQLNEDYNIEIRGMSDFGLVFGNVRFIEDRNGVMIFIDSSKNKYIFPYKCPVEKIEHIIGRRD